MSSMTDTSFTDRNFPAKSSTTAVAWGAIIGGAFSASAVSLILLILGSALGLSTLSPWSHQQSVASFTVKTAIWLIVMQWVASGVGGYLAGRLRSKWTGMHSDEVFFRDTAHGFLAWAVATILTASLLASAAATAVGAAGRAGEMAMPGMASEGIMPPPPPHEAMGGAADTNGYYIDSLFRSTSVAATAPTPELRAETTRILMLGMKNGTVPDADKAYLALLVSNRTGLNNVDASKRVDDVIASLNTTKEKARQDAEAARKTAMHVSLYLFLSLLIGAFIASAAGAVGGRHRDEY